MRNWKVITVLLISFLLILYGCSPSALPPTPKRTAEWAEAQVHAYLEDLAQGPEALRYLADLYSECYVDTHFSQSEVGKDYKGHKYSGWQVYLKPTNHPSKEHWNNLNWAVYEDGYVTEGSNDALRVKADLIELSQSKH